MDNPREVDVSRFYEQLFRIWLSSEESAKRIFQANYNFSKNGKLMVLKRIDAGDPLDIKFFGTIYVKQDGDHVGFYSTHKQSKAIRLALVFKSRKSSLIGSDYDQISNQFLSQATSFLSRMRETVLE